MFEVSEGIIEKLVTRKSTEYLNLLRDHNTSKSGGLIDH